MTDIVIPSTIAAMPPAPQLTDTQADFNAKAFSTVGAFPTFIAQTNDAAAATYINAVASQERATTAQGSASAAVSARDRAEAAALTAVNAPGTMATSISAVAIGTGSRTVVVQAGKSFAPGQTIVVAASADPAALRLVGVVTAYDAATGALTFLSIAYTGSGTVSGWVVTLSAARDGMVTLAAFDAGMLEAAPPGKRGEFYAIAPPAGWLKANGAAVSRTTYARLYSIIGTYYGAGDGSTTFNLPDDRGLFPRGYDDGRGVDPGRIFGSEQASQNIAHQHVATDTGHVHGTYDPGHGHVGSTNSAGGHNHGGQQIPQVASDVDRGTGASIFSLDAGQSIPTDGAHAHTVTANPNISNISIVTGAANIAVTSSGGAEARPINRAVLVCIKY